MQHIKILVGTTKKVYIYTIYSVSHFTVFSFNPSYHNPIVPNHDFEITLKYSANFVSNMPKIISKINHLYEPYPQQSLIGDY